MQIQLMVHVFYVRGLNTSNRGAAMQFGSVPASGRSHKNFYSYFKALYNLPYLFTILTWRCHIVVCYSELLKRCVNANGCALKLDIPSKMNLTLL